MNDPAASAAHVMRRRAEDLARERMAQLPQSLQALSPQEMQQLMHELQVHQIELEMQNDELRRSQRELEAARARYFDLYDLAPIGYLTVGESGLVLEANLSAATLLGVSRSELVKRPFRRFIVNAQQDVFYQCRNRLTETGQAQTCELQVRQSEGTALWVKLDISSAQASDGSPVLRVILDNISERRFLDQALQETNRKLENAVQIADKANQAKSDFLSGMSHELRSPLNAILGFAQLMESGTPAPTASQQASISQILSGGWYLLSLINEILDLALIESGKLALALEPVSLAEKLIHCQDMIEPLAQKNDVHISIAGFDTPCFVQADRTRLKQVIVNLLTNAIKYNHIGGSVEVSWEVSAGGRVRVNVRDKGPGLSAEKLAQLFQPFNRLGQESGSQEGTGIGLVVCKRLVEMMGGSIGAESTVGVGSVFWFELNRAEAPTETAVTGTATAPSSSVPRPDDAQLRTLLYVEDNQANVALVEQLLVRRPHLRLLRAGNGTGGVALARMHQPDVILMDINLPGIDGFQALRLLQEDPATQHIPVLALSANAMPHDIAKGLTAGFLRYLTKPIKVDEFMAVLDMALDQSLKPR